MIHLMYWTVLLPLIGFIINGVFGSKIKNEKIIGIIGSGAIGLSFLIALFAFFETLALPVDLRKNYIDLFTWLSAGNLNIHIAYQIDQLSLVMSLIVTGVGFVIHVYSIGYMHGDKSFWRFFAYLNLFIFAMMNLILADNFVLLFLGWEGVGLCSYLLIGFWYDKKFEKGTTGDAAKKAFIVNRIGDFGFLLGMFLIYLTFGSLNFSDVFTRADVYTVKESVFNLIALFLFIGATGKSAQIPLYIWLPDAMAGPTPVSALIHAATMVTAGVYMVARCSIIYASAPAILMVVAIIGAFTALFAATIGLVQNDIKKVLAYSTVSQLGYMFLALGVGAFTAGIFHVMTHAFFKALLFLGAGSIIHSMHEEQDIRHYGGLKKYMPQTFLTFLVAALAISGIPPLSGFFSKDEILWYSFANGSVILWIIGAGTALLTAFYMFRLYYLTFEGKPRFGHDKHPHESPKVMTIPLIILAVLSAIGGFIGIPALFSGEGGNAFHNWLAPVFEKAEEKLVVYGSHSHGQEILLMAISIVLAVGGILIARAIYIKKPSIADNLAKRFKGAYNLLLNKYFVDEAYETVIIKPIVKGSESILWKIADNKIIDGLVNGVASLVNVISRNIRKIQTGIAQSYAIVMMLGIVNCIILDYNEFIIMENSSLITYLLLIPIVGSILLLFINNKKENIIRYFGLGISLIVFVISLIVYFNFDISKSGFQFVQKILWIENLHISYTVGIDGLSLLLVLLTTFITPLTLISSWSSIQKRVKEFTFFMILLEVGMLGVFVSLDMFLFYIFWEAMLIPMYFIIGIWGGAERIYASVKFFIYTMFGSLLMLVAIVWLAVYASTPLGHFTTDLVELYKVGPSIPATIQNYMFLAFAFSFAIKVPLFPLHTWLPDAHVQAPTAGSVILAGVLLKMGTYGLLRFCLPLFPHAAINYAPVISILAIIGIIYGALVAMVQKDMKKLVAYSSVAHLGFVVLGIFAMTQEAVQGAVIQMINHGLSTGALFLLVGVIYERTHTREISEYGGIAKIVPIFSFALMFASLSSIGLPGLNGFVGEFLILLGSFKSPVLNSWWYTIFAASGVIFAAVYLLWMYQRVVFGEVKNPKLNNLKDMNKREIFVLVPIFIFIIWIGIYPSTFLKVSEKTTSKIIHQVFTPHQTAELK